MLQTYLDLLDLCYFEVTEAFGGLADENVWRRPHERLLSVGELAAHIAFAEASRFAGEESDGSATKDLSNCKISSPLLHARHGYYLNTIETTGAETLTAAQVLSELERVHAESMAFLTARNPDLNSPAPHWHSTYKELLKYLIFHISYHTGQMYSARHILGETTPDN